MKRDALHESYQHRFERVFDYLFEHLDQDLTLERVAAVAHLSPHHFHRLYRGVTGETLAATVRRLRLHLAASMLSRDSLPLLTIARRAGYASQQTFSRGFRDAYGVPPGGFREQAAHTSAPDTSSTNGANMYTVTITSIAVQHLAGYSHAGDYMLIGHAFEKLNARLAFEQFDMSQCRMLAVYFDDPSATPVQALRSFAALAFDSSEIEMPVVGLPADLERMTLEGGEYAVLEFKGPYSELHHAYEWLYGSWLPQSQRTPADGAPFEWYVNNPRNTPAHELITRIHLPLQASHSASSKDTQDRSAPI